nr:putative mitochondrial protein [Ipomoea batatas]
MLFETLEKVYPRAFGPELRAVGRLPQTTGCKWVFTEKSASNSNVPGTPAGENQPHLAQASFLRYEVPNGQDNGDTLLYTTVHSQFEDIRAQYSNSDLQVGGAINFSPEAHGIPHQGQTVDNKGHSGGIACLWRKSPMLDILSYSDHHIDATMTLSSDNKRWRLTGFYGEPDRSNRHRGWHLLKNLSMQSNLPRVVMGAAYVNMYSPASEMEMENKSVVEDGSDVDWKQKVPQPSP